MPILIAVIVIVVIVGLIALVYNGLVSSRNRVDNGWSQIDVQLTRRHDLIPNLVQTVKGYAAHESKTLEAVTAARNMAASATGVEGKADAENALTGTLKSLFAVSEAYPDLKANQNFLALQEELSTTENKIAFARQYYNDVVTTFNTKIQSFPGVVVAKLGSFEPRTTFKADAGAGAVPEVSF